MTDGCDDFLGNAALALEDEAGSDLMLVLCDVSHVVLCVGVSAGREANVRHLMLVNRLEKIKTLFFVGNGSKWKDFHIFHILIVA